MTFFQLFRLFLWKNIKHITFNWISISLILIGCFTTLFIYLCSTQNVTIYPETKYDTQNEGLLKSYFAGGDNDFIYYSPTNAYIDDLMESVRLDLSVSSERLLPFQKPDDMFLAIEENKNAQSFAILFKNTTNDKGISYAISSISNRISTATVYLNDENVVGIKEFDEYTASGFFILQRAIDKNFIKIHTENEPQTEIEVAPFPTREVEVIDSSRIISFSVIFSLLICVLLLITFLVPFVEEKQNGVKEFLSLTTPYSYLNGITFYITRFIIYFLYGIFAIIMGYIYNAIGITSIFWLISLLLFFILSSMCYTMLISVFFNSVFYAKAAGALLLFVPCILFFSEGSILQYYPFFFSETTFLEGMRILQIFTNKHKIITVNDFYINITPSSYKLINIYMILIIQCFVYSVLYLYLSYIFPGPGGISQPFYFFLKPSFYKSSSTQSSSQYINNIHNNQHDNNQNVILEIKNLTKIINKCCDDSKKIINNLNFDIYDKRITVLLGHNGAGKTTTINMIIGAVDKTCGEISVCGFKDPSLYHHLIGYCPQYSIFMEYLNCFDHLKFFAQLRGLDDYEAEKIANLLLNKLRLTDKANEPGKNLSGGMKRRLSLGMAVTGNTKLIILDEPSSGLDPESRRQLWDILLELRKTQSILLTTHFMEEAEVLGDNVAILSNGKLICDGVPMSLKRKYKCGYILKLLVDEDNFEKQKIMDIIQHDIPNAKIKALINPTLCISLPYEQEHKYPIILRNLEDNMSSLGIKSISITNSSLEDVFLNCTSSDEVDSVNKTFSRNTGDIYMHIKDNGTDATLTSTFIPKFGQQSFAVLYKKWIFLKRLWSYSLFMFSLPFAAIALSYFIINSQRTNISSTIELNLDLRHLPMNEVLIQISSEISFMREHFEDVMKPTNSIPKFIVEHQSLKDEILKRQHDNLANFYQNVIGAVRVYNDEIGKIHFEIFYSPNIVHSSSIMLNLIDNVILRYSLKDDSIQIETSNIPIRRINEVSPAKLEYYAYMVPVGWFFYILFYISLPFEEDKTEFKKLQNISPLTYWSSFTFYDMILHTIICVLTYFFQKSLPFHDIYNDDELLWLTTTFILYGFAYLPILYVCSSSFKSLSTLTAFLFSLFIISTVIPDITSSNKAAMNDYSEIIAILLFLPDFALKHQIKVINENYFLNRRNALISSKKIGLNEDLIKLNLTGKQEETIDTTTFYFYSILVFISCEFFLIFLWENMRKRQIIIDFCNLKSFRKRNNKTESTDVDEVDVQRERDEVDSIFSKHLESRYPLIVSKLQKSYGNLLAVNQISFAVKQGECFGLLGLNGAGKTSTFEMITGNMKINGGKVLIDRASVNKNINLYKSLLGYCPQGNALICHMTAYEILKYIAMIRGVRDPNNEVRRWLERLDLVRYKNIPIMNYSGGTKRKLNTAIAMIGNPKVLFLDEPTAGVDPKSRRFIWKCIQQFQNDNKTIVLTSHSMDECENLCNRLAIMAKGKFQCIGYIPMLKANFGSGFTIMLRIKENANDEDIEKLKTDICIKFRCDIREQFAGVITYFVNDDTVYWSVVFQKLEQIYNIHKQTILLDYSVNEATLEDIFLKFENKCRNIETSLM